MYCSIAAKACVLETVHSAMSRLSTTTTTTETDTATTKEKENGEKKPYNNKEKTERKK